MDGCGLMLGIIDVALVASLVAASAFDVRFRRFPHALAFCLLALCVLRVFLALSPQRFYAHIVCAALFFSLLFAMEYIWRLACGRVGLGMGDVKFASCLVVIDPVLGMASFGVGMLGVAVVLVATRGKTAPCIPYCTGAFLLLCAMCRIGG